MRIDWDIPVVMDDGLALRADVFRPVPGGRYPVLLSCGPYGKGLRFEEGRPEQWRRLCQDHPDVPAGTSSKYANWEVADPEKWVPHGYAMVRIDSRGMGRSPGYVDQFSPRETRDLYDCVAWAAAQPWCTGKVGLQGISYSAMNQWQVAALNPPGLAAICPWEGAADHYREVRRNGGILTNFLMRWFENRIPKAQHGIAGRGERNPVTGVLAFGDELRTEEERAASRADLIAEIRDHPLIDDYLRERNADLSRITVPVLSAGNLGGQGLHLRGNVEGFLRAGSPRKWLELHVGEHWAHFYTDYGRELQLRFFDHFLKGEDNGWDATPPVLLNVRHIDGTTTFRHEDGWPIPRTRWTRLYLDLAARTLTPEPPAEDQCLDYRALEEEITFCTVVSADTEITGPAAASLFVSSSTTDADLFLTLRVYAPDGREITFAGANDPHMPVSQGWLRASHRKLDPDLSTPWRPFHTHDEAQPLAPGERYGLEVEIWPTSVVVPKGYTLALTVAGRDDGKHSDPLDRPAEVFGGTVTLYAGKARPASILLPIVPEA